jgi:hypothetical protein
MDLFLHCNMAYHRTLLKKIGFESRQARSRKREEDCDWQGTVFTTSFLTLTHAVDICSKITLVLTFLF